MSTIKPPTGRQRSKDAHQAVLTATARLLETELYPAITADRIAQESGVSKRTLYRWWRNKAEIILEVVQQDDIQAPDTGSIERDLTALFTAIFHRVTTDQRAQAIKGLLMDAQYDPDFAEHFRAYIHTRREVTLTLLRRACERRELSGNINIDLTAFR